jgi:L-alanine-DL-glutamate epimerase-like enolase superfamily enzyme
VRIVDVREKTFRIASPIRNACIDVSRTTLSHIAVITDVQRDGRPVGHGGVENGHVTVPDLPGIGFEGKADLIREMRGPND